MNKVLVLDEQRDNVAVALTQIELGAKITLHINQREMEFAALNEIPSGHKIALTRIEQDQIVVKYGHRIGRARTTIEQGQHVHDHNLRSMRGKELDLRG